MQEIKSKNIKNDAWCQKAQGQGFHKYPKVKSPNDGESEVHQSVKGPLLKLEPCDMKLNRFWKMVKVN